MMQEPRRRQAGCTGLTLVEMMMAMAVLAVFLLGFGSTILQLDRTNSFMQDRAIAHKAAQQMLEVVLNESMDDTLSRASGDPHFDVLGLTYYEGLNFGTISATDLNWDSASDVAYQITIDVTIPTTKEVLARMNTVKTR